MLAEPVDLSPAFKTFMTGLIDYAGLFPPARLPLPEAITNYRRYREESEQWMLSRFIIPAGRLAELADFGPFPADKPFPFSVLGRGGETVDDFMAWLEEDVALVAAFRTKHGAGVQADMLELRLPADLLAARDGAALLRLLVAAAEIIIDQGQLRPFFEAPLGAAWRETVDTVVNALATYNEQSGHRVGFKLRCGGLDAAAFPSRYQIAHVIAACRDAGVPMKATAGLHHPFHHFDKTLQTHMHGFVNLFAAAIVARTHNLPEHEIAAIVADENPAHFVFADQSFTWLDRVVTVEQLHSARQEALISYGSCSFEEPREDLQLLGWL